MKAQMKELIDVDNLIERLDTNNVPYCGKIENIIATMPKFNVYSVEVEVEVEANDCPKNGNDDFDFKVALRDNSCDCENKPTENEPVEEVPTYVQRMIAEYHELKDKYNKLHRMLVKHEAGTLDFEPTCPIELLERQAKVMREYLHILEVRAEIESAKL